MQFPIKAILYILLVETFALAGPIAPKPTDLSSAGGSGPVGHCLFNTISEQAQTQGVHVQPHTLNVTLSGKKGGSGGGGSGGHGGGTKGPKGGAHGGGASNMKCELGLVLLVCVITIMA